MRAYRRNVLGATAIRLSMLLLKMLRRHVFVKGAGVHLRGRGKVILFIKKKALLQGAV